ncbi:MAG: hypothetical protein EAZ09_01325 [Oscillatoriales cyanobacterium]|nr:MAG: hypothetical protein EAZ18_23435 [Oscillatoriales cyanobacterium]TAH25961.1 MAG: hypothetical protein EAZ09_01325 [Oscillatoriales cyanobacterium]
MKTLLRLLLKTQHQRNRSRLTQTEKGMTLVELLVGSIMAFLIITPMLGFVVDMLNTDRREQVKSNTEQDLQTAVDFISQDLSQAIYIYDQEGIKDIQKTTTKLPPSPANTTGTPILVFWKRQQMKNSLPINKVINENVKPRQCDNAGINCNDTYVLSLVAYYQIKENDQKSIWCQPSGDTCPTRIARYEIREPIRNPYTENAEKPYYDPADLSDSQQGTGIFNPEFSFSNPTEKLPTGGSTNPEVLVNYIDHNPGPTLPLTECRTALGNPTDPKTTTPISEDTLKVTDKTTNTNSFYACVDTEKNIARVTIRGNSLRRLQADAKYDLKNPQSPFFPTASVQVKGLSGLGK